MNMRILFYGDPHGVFEPLIETVQAHPPAAVVLLGDMDLEAPLEQVLAPILHKTEVWFIHGNHDCDRQHWHDHLLASALKERNLHGRVVEIAGTRIAGLGGVFREKIWHPETGGPQWEDRTHYLRCRPPHVKKQGIPLKHRASIWWDDYEALWDQRADLLVTHEAPSCHAHGFAALDDLAEALGARRIIHGHHHANYAGQVGQGIQVQGVARAGVIDQHGAQLFNGIGRHGERL